MSTSLCSRYSFMLSLWLQLLKNTLRPVGWMTGSAGSGWLQHHSNILSSADSEKPVLMLIPVFWCPTYSHIFLIRALIWSLLIFYINEKIRCSYCTITYFTVLQIPALLVVLETKTLFCCYYHHSCIDVKAEFNSCCLRWDSSHCKYTVSLALLLLLEVGVLKKVNFLL